jgi:hypothetical protein
MSEWRAHVGYDFDALRFDAARVVLYRRLGDDGAEQIVGFDADRFGAPILERTPAGTSARSHGLLVPVEALQALAAAVTPGPAEREMARLEDALAVERARVDRVLSAIDRGTA